MEISKRQRAAFLRAISRFEKAVDDKAFEGTIPYDSDAALQAHDEIARNYDRAKAALVRQFEKAVLGA